MEEIFPEEWRKIRDTLLGAKEFPKDLTLLLITDKGYIRVQNRTVSISSYEDELYFIKKLSYHPNARGEILEIFSKLDFILDRIIILNIIEPNSEKEIMLNDILQEVSSYKKIKLLYEYNILDSNDIKIKKPHENIRRVRNALAHEWDIYQVQYKGKPIKENLDEFKKDLEVVWKIISDLYKKEQQKIDVKSILKEIK